MFVFQTCLTAFYGKNHQRLLRIALSYLHLFTAFTKVVANTKYLALDSNFDLPYYLGHHKYLKCTHEHRAEHVKTLEFK